MMNDDESSDWSQKWWYIGNSKYLLLRALDRGQRHQTVGHGYGQVRGNTLNNPKRWGYFYWGGQLQNGKLHGTIKLLISDIHQLAMCAISLMSHHWSEHLQTDHLPLLLLTLFRKVDVVTNLFMSVRDFHLTTCPEFMWYQWGDYVRMIISTTNICSLYCTAMWNTHYKFGAAYLLVLKSALLKNEVHSLLKPSLPAWPISW